MNRLNVLHAHNHLGIGGTEKSLEIIARNMDKKRFNVYICGLRETGVRARKLREDGYEVRLLTSEEELSKYLKKKNIHILHIHGSAGEFPVKAAKKAKVPVVIKMTNFGWTDRPSIEKRIDVYLFVSKMILLRFLKLKGLSSERDFLHKKYRFLYHPLDFDEIKYSKEQKLRESLGISKKTPLLGKIGRSAPSKWSVITIKAFEKVSKKISDVKFILVNEPKKIKQEVIRRNLQKNVIFLNSIPYGKVSNFYNSIDILTHSSKIGESFGYVIAEAMAHGKPVIVNSTPMRDNAQVELVDNRVNGYIANNPNSYAEAIIKLLKSKKLRKKMGRKGFEKAKRKFSSENIIDNIESLYMELAKKKGIIEESGVEFKDDFNLDRFSSEYNKRLNDYFGNNNIGYELEKLNWKIVSNPVIPYKEKIYSELKSNIYQ